MTRWFRRWLLPAVVVLLFALAGGAVAVRSLWFHEWLRHNLVSRSHAFLTGDLTVGSLSGDVLHGVTLHDVVLRQDGDLVISARTMTLTYSLFGLYGGDVGLDSVTVESPAIALVEREDGWNVARLFRDRGPRPMISPSPFAIRHLRVAGAHVTLQPLRAMRHEFVNVNAAGSLSYASGLTRLTVDSIAGNDPATSLGVTQGSVHLLASAGDWRFDDVTLVTTGSNLTGRARVNQQGGEPVTDIELHAGALSLEEVGRYVPAFARHPLTVRVDATAKGPSRATEVHFDASSSPAGKLSGTFVTDLTGSAVRANGAFKGDVYGTRADVRVQWTGGPTPWIAVAGNASGVDLPRLGHEFGIIALIDRRLQGRLNATLDVQWRGTDSRDLAGSGTVRLTDSTLGGARLRDMRIEGQLERTRVTAGVNGSFGAVDLKAFGLVDAIPTSANGDVRARVVIADVRAAPRVNDIDVTGAVSLGPSEIAGQRVDAGAVEGSLVKGLATLTRFDLSGQELTMRATGQVALAGSGSSNLSYTVRTPNLAPTGALAGRELAGSASAEGTLTGSGGRVTTTGTLSALRFAYGSSAAALTLNAKFTMTLDGWRLDGVTGTATADGSFLTLGGVSIDHASAKASLGPSGIDFDAAVDAPRRSLKLAGNAIIHSDHQEWHVRQLTAGANGVVWGLAPGQEATIRYGRGRLAVEHAALVRGAQRISVDGSLQFDQPAGGESSVNVHLDRVQAADLNALALGTQKLTGQIDGTGRITGTLQSPAVDATVSVGSGSVNGVAFRQARGTVTYRNTAVSIDADLQQNETNRLTAKGTVPLGGKPGLDLRIDSAAIDIGLFQVFTSRLQRMHGAAGASLRLTGSTKAPAVSGSFEATDVGFDVTDTGVPYQHVNARLRFDAQRVHIDQLSLADGDGHTLKAQGGVAGWLSGPQALDVQLIADGVHVLKNAFAELNVDGSVHVGGTLDRPDLRGTLRARTAKVQADRWLDRYVTSGAAYTAAPDPFTRASAAGRAAGEAAAAAPPVPGSLFDRTATSLTMELPDNVLVRGRDLKVADSPVGLGDINVTVGGRLRYDKPAGAGSSVTGRLEVVRGTYYFQGRPFQVVSGSSIEFRGQRPPNPTLAVSADREISGVVARIAVRGTAQRPRLTLSSSPPLDESDVLSLLVFNQPINDLDLTQRNSLANRAAAFAEGAVTSPLSDSVARALNLDLFDIRPSDASSAPVVTVGRQVGAVYVSAEQRFGEAPGSTVAVEYRISRIVKLVTSFVQGVQQTMVSRWAEQTGVDLIFVLRY